MPIDMTGGDEIWRGCPLLDITLSLTDAVVTKKLKISGILGTFGI